jgi:2-methylcitrate dehydratase PrpD
MSTGSKLAEIITGLSYEDFPPPVVLNMKRVILDSIGCALGGRITDRGRIALEVVAELGGNPQSVIIGGGRTSWTLAAYANAELIQALDYEPCGPRFGHIVPYVISPCLSIAQRTRASGKELITAVVLALEVGSRVFNSVPGKTDVDVERRQNFLQSFGSTQVYGGVAGVSSLLKLDAKHISHAMGIAGTNLPVPAGHSWHIMPRPSIMTKFNTLTGWVAELSTMACLLAERGFTGDTTFLDSEEGFRGVIGAKDDFQPETIIGDLGQRWWSEDWNSQFIKAYPLCGANHAGVDLIIHILRQSGISPESIQEIVVTGDPTTPPWTLPFTDPVSFSDCSHNNAYAYAVAAYHGQNPGPLWLLPSTFNDPRIRNLMRKVRVEALPKTENALVNPVYAETTVEVTANGRKYSASGKSQFPGVKVELPGDTRPPMKDDEIKAKFRNNAGYSSLTKEKVEKIIHAVYRMEEMENVSTMLAMMGE